MVGYDWLTIGSGGAADAAPPRPSQNRRRENADVEALWVAQVVVLLSDADAAARWFMTKARRFEDLEGRQDEGFVYRKVDLDITLTGLGEEAAVAVPTQTRRRGAPNVDTYINFRTGRLFGGVVASTYKELEVQPQLRKLADAFLSRMETILAENEG